LKKELNIPVSPVIAGDQERLKEFVSTALKIEKSRINGILIRRRSIDARKSNILINLGLDVYIDEKLPEIRKPVFSYPDVSGKRAVIIVGAGPAGLFSALRLIELGYKPVIVERGKPVTDRKRDIAAIYHDHLIDPDSNYGFGEGGAGTFSDGKLFTRSKKRGDVNKILEVLHFHGAQDEILIEAHPHIGSNVLPRVITSIRESIEKAGGQILFNSRVTDLILKNGEAAGVVLKDGSSLEGAGVILATGHSARDIYHLLERKGIDLEAKSFAVGVRVEHPQELINRIQYHGSQYNKFLPPAIYSFVEQVLGRGVYSFCMCPGGVVVPASTAPGELVVNGMSSSERGGPFANSGMVVEIHPEDLQKEFQKFGKFAGLRFQSEIEKTCFIQAGSTQFATAQRLDDFINNRISSALPKSSYRPGLVSSPMHQWLPEIIRPKLQEGFKLMGKKAKGFITNEAIILGVESRTSSPVRIPRDPETLEHITTKKLFPCGEGAGYAGGIVSSAIDGERVAEKISMML
jgi:uncharacterized FAD-dependent dehydrogenase